MKKKDFKGRASVEILQQYIAASYAPIGENINRDEVTSADILLAVREMCDVSVEEVSSMMQGAGFQITYINSRPYWVVYLR